MLPYPLTSFCRIMVWTRLSQHELYRTISGLLSLSLFSHSYFIFMMCCPYSHEMGSVIVVVSLPSYVLPRLWILGFLLIYLYIYIYLPPSLLFLCHAVLFILRVIWQTFFKPAIWVFSSDWYFWLFNICCQGLYYSLWKLS